LKVPEVSAFTGGRIPGVFTVSLQITQTDGANQIPVTSSLKIESSDTLSIQAANLRSRATRKAVITFPDYDDVVNAGVPAIAADGNRYLASSASTPATFGEDGQIPAESECQSVASTHYGPPGRRRKTNLGHHNRWRTRRRVILRSRLYKRRGKYRVQRQSQDFPVTSNAPRPVPGSSSQDVFLSYFDRDSGQLRNATYTGIAGAAWTSNRQVDPAARCRRWRRLLHGRSI